MIVRLFAVLASLALFVLGPAAARAEPRVALAVGNAAYETGALATPVNDAGLMVENLRSAGFDVVAGADLDLRACATACANSSGSSRRRDRTPRLSSTSRATASSSRATTSWCPWARGSAGDRHPVRGIPAQRPHPFDGRAALGHAHRDAGSPRPFPALRGRQDIAPGLVLVDPPEGFLLSYSTGPDLAFDEGKGPYGAYASAFIEMMRQPGMAPDELFAKLRVRVHETTQGRQTPWDTAKLTQPFAFFEPEAGAPLPPVATAPPPRARSFADLGPDEAYAIAVERDTIPAYQDYLRVYPNVVYSARVKRILAIRREALFWQRTLVRNTPEAYWTYLRRYPDGPHAIDCDRRLARLSAPIQPPRFFDEVEYDLPPPLVGIEVVRPDAWYIQDDYPPPPPPPMYLLPPREPDFFLPPPPPPRSAGFLPIPVPVPFPNWARRPPPPPEPVFIQGRPLPAGVFPGGQRPPPPPAVTQPVQAPGAAPPPAPVPGATPTPAPGTPVPPPPAGTPPGGPRPPAPGATPTPAPGTPVPPPPAGTPPGGPRPPAPGATPTPAPGTTVPPPPAGTPPGGPRPPAPGTAPTPAPGTPVPPPPAGTPPGGPRPPAPGAAPTPAPGATVPSPPGLQPVPPGQLRPGQIAPPASPGAQPAPGTPPAPGAIRPGQPPAPPTPATPPATPPGAQPAPDGIRPPPPGAIRPGQPPAGSSPPVLSPQPVRPGPGEPPLIRRLDPGQPLAPGQPPRPPVAAEPPRPVPPAVAEPPRPAPPSVRSLEPRPQPQLAPQREQPQRIQPQRPPPQMERPAPPPQAAPPVVRAPPPQAAPPVMRAPPPPPQAAPPVMRAPPPPPPQAAPPVMRAPPPPPPQAAPQPPRPPAPPPQAQPPRPPGPPPQAAPQPQRGPPPGRPAGRIAVTLGNRPADPLRKKNPGRPGRPGSFWLRFKARYAFVATAIERSALQHGEQAGRVPAPAAHLLDFGVELVDQRGDRQCAPLRRASSRQIDRSLRIQSTAKPKSNLPCVHGLVAVLHLPGLGGALRNRLETASTSRPALLGEMHALGSPCTRPAMQIWLTILVSWPAPEPGRSGGRRAQSSRSRARRGRRCPASPPHMTVSTPFSAPAWPPETGASMKPKPRLRRLPVELARDFGRGGGVVDEDRARCHAREGAVGPDGHRAQVVVIADAGEDDLLAHAAASRRLRGLAAMFPDPFLGLGECAVVDGDLVPLAARWRAIG